MSLGKDPFDELAYALVESEFDFDAVERADRRAEWAADGTSVEVTDRSTGETVVYTADDLVLATSDREVQNARKPPGSAGG